MTLKLCVAQLNFVVGDMPGNAQKIVDAARSAYADGARLLLTPELSICGYAAEDLFLRPAFITACDDAVKTVARELAGLKDWPWWWATRPGATAARAAWRAAALQRGQRAAGGEVIATYAKRELPNYQVFDERRYFTPGQGTCVFEAGGRRRHEGGPADLRGRLV
jgi:NAD+ synthase (glutamine-hydrolysing)